MVFSGMVGAGLFYSWQVQSLKGSKRLDALYPKKMT
jgi:hypothetical protein